MVNTAKGTMDFAKSEISINSARSAQNITKLKLGLVWQRARRLLVMMVMILIMMMAKSDDDEDDDKYEPILMMSNDSLAAGDDHTGFPAKCSLSQVFSEQVGQ